MTPNTWAVATLGRVRSFTAWAPAAATGAALLWRAPTQLTLPVVQVDVPDRDGAGTGELVVLLTTLLDPVDARAERTHRRDHPVR